jgi:CheY-like chemotaxis protein
MGARMGKKKILIVDDERDAMFILEKELAARGYSVIASDNGNDALNLAKSERPDLIILDLVMPDMDGAEVAAKLKEDLQSEERRRGTRACCCRQGAHCQTLQYRRISNSDRKACKLAMRSSLSLAL